MRGLSRSRVADVWKGGEPVTEPPAPKIAKAGRLVYVDQGEFSDHEVIGFFVVLLDFEPLKLLSGYLEKNPEQKEDYNFDPDKFLAFLLSEGLLLEIYYDNLDLGSHGRHKTLDFYGGPVTVR